MKLNEIIKINKNLIELKNSNEKFKIDIGSTLLYNLNLTNDIVNKNNTILSDFIEANSVLDGYEYVLDDENKFNSKLDELNNSDIECDLKYISLDSGEEYTLRTIELLTPIIIEK
jgi:hypothetical protein